MRTGLPLPTRRRQNAVPPESRNRTLVGVNSVAGAAGVFPGILATCATGLCSGRHMSRHSPDRRRVSNSWLIGFWGGIPCGHGKMRHSTVLGFSRRTRAYYGIAGLIHHRLSKESPLKPIVKKIHLPKRSAQTHPKTTPTAPLRAKNTLLKSLMPKPLSCFSAYCAHATRWKLLYDGVRLF